MKPSPFFLLLTSLPALFITTLTLPAKRIGVLTYAVEGEAIVIVDCRGNTVGAVKIPETIENKVVLAIGESAFAGCSRVTSIAIPDSTTEVRSGAFYGCVSLKNHFPT